MDRNKQEAKLDPTGLPRLPYSTWEAKLQGFFSISYGGPACLGPSFTPLPTHTVAGGLSTDHTSAHTDTPDGDVWVTEPSRASLQKQSVWVAIGARRTELWPRPRHLRCCMTLTSHLTSRPQAFPAERENPLSCLPFLLPEHFQTQG